MATLKSKRKKQAEIETINEELEQSAPVEETPVEEVPAEESQYLNEAEQEALAKQKDKDDEESKKVSSIKMTKAVEVVSDEFNLYDKNFVVTGFADKGSKCQIAVSNGDFDIVITVKDAEKFGIL